MILSSYKAEIGASIEKLINYICRGYVFRKLLLYPTELRGRSATYIFQIATRLQPFYTHSHHI